MKTYELYLNAWKNMILYIVSTTFVNEIANLAMTSKENHI